MTTTTTTSKKMSRHLTVSAHLLCVAALPGSVAGTTDGVVGAVTLDTKSTVLATSRGKSTSLSVLVHRRADPVDTGIIADDLVERIDTDDLKVLVGGILVDPVGVQHTHVHDATTASLLSNGAEVTCELQVVDTSVDGLAVDHTDVVRTLAATATDSDTVDGITLLGLVTELVGLVGTSRAVDLVDLLALTVLPGSVRRKGDVREKKKRGKRS